MFDSTEVKNKKDFLDISACFLDAKDKNNNKLLVDKLGLNSAFFLAYNNWYIVNGKLHYYKNFYKNIFNELFLSELVKEYKLKNLEYKLVNSKDGVGIISESFKKPDKKYLDYDYYFNSFGIKNEPDNMPMLNKTLKKLISDKNRIKLMNEFYRLTAFDFFSGQTDRSAGNLIFEIGDETCLAPIFDNESSLNYVKLNSKKINYKVLYASLLTAFDHLEFYFGDYLSDSNFYVFNLINNNFEFYKYLCLCLDIDINKILDRTIEKYGLIVPECDRKELLDFFDIKKSIIESTLSLAKKYK